MTRKQKLYLEILERILPFMRNIQTHSAWQRFRYGSFYPELELVHNLPQLLLIPHFSEHDMRWLNAQARTFVRDGDNPAHAFYEPITACIAELFTLVPEPLKEKLQWQGPKLKQASSPSSWNEQLDDGRKEKT
jgi:hypothetical protein